MGGHQNKLLLIILMMFDNIMLLERFSISGVCLILFSLFDSSLTFTASGELLGN